MSVTTINQELLNNYLSTLSPKNQEIVKKVVENTVYVTTSEMIRGIRESLVKFISEHPRYNLYIPKLKIGSEHYILLQCEDFLKPEEIYFGFDNKVSAEIPTIILDDGIYSGNNLCGHIDGLLYEDYESGTFDNSKFYCIVYSYSGKCSLDYAFPGVNVISTINLENMGVGKLFSEDFGYFYENFGIETENVLPIYFEHKIANEFGSWQFYHKIIDPMVSRKIDAITWDDVKSMIERLK